MAKKNVAYKEPEDFFPPSVRKSVGMGGTKKKSTAKKSNKKK